MVSREKHNYRYRNKRRSNGFAKSAQMQVGARGWVAVSVCWVIPRKRSVQAKELRYGDADRGEC